MNNSNTFLIHVAERKNSFMFNADEYEKEREREKKRKEKKKEIKKNDNEIFIIMNI